MRMDDPGRHPVILFDGHCGLCNASVRFVLRHEVRPDFRFAPLQSGWAQAQAKGALDVDQLNTVYLVDSEGVHARSDAVLRIARQLRPPWRWLAVCLMIPRPVRDAVYRLIGRLRYALFGRSAYCAVATPAVQDRFLATDERDQTPR